MAIDNSKKEQAAKIFKSYPDAKELYMTSDNQFFMGGQVGLNNAKRHAETLGKGDKAAKPELVKREDCAEQLKALADKATAKAKAKVLEAKDLNYKKMAKAALVDECSKRTPAIEIPEGATNADIIALLEADDAKA